MQKNIKVLVTTTSFQDSKGDHHKCNKKSTMGG